MKPDTRTLCDPAYVLPDALPPNARRPAFITPRERATILAALRHWQHVGMHGARAPESADTLTETEIDTLRERLER